MLEAAARVVFALILALAVSLLLLRILPRLPLGRRLILETGLPASGGYASAPEGDERWHGKTGETISPLRPAGIALIEGERVDVVSNGEFIEPGTVVRVTRVDGSRIVVRRDLKSK
jgi:membrane-bound serine protease (ClpP class)